MSHHCHTEHPLTRQKKVLWMVLIINFSMFLLELFYGLVGHSLSLIGDSLEMLGDALAYGMSLYVVEKNLVFKAKASLLKGLMMLFLGAVVFVKAVFLLFEGSLPDPKIMGTVGSCALFANFTCAVLLARYRHEDINMKSVWTCSRNDMISSVLTLIAAVLVVFLENRWPDFLVGLAMTSLCVYSGLSVIKESFVILKH